MKFFESHAAALALALPLPLRQLRHGTLEALACEGAPGVDRQTRGVFLTGVEAPRFTGGV